MGESRTQLAEVLEGYYRGWGFALEGHDDGSVRAAGVGGVTWIGLPVVADDLADETFANRLLELSEERMPRGERCPFELLPAEECADELHALLTELRLERRRHVEIYSLSG